MKKIEKNKQDLCVYEGSICEKERERMKGPLLLWDLDRLPR
jgi:hypothetical protein